LFLPESFVPIFREFILEKKISGVWVFQCLRIPSTESVEELTLHMGILTNKVKTRKEKPRSPESGLVDA